MRRTVPYATLEQFENSIYSEDGHDVTQKLLERASNKIDRMLFNASYEVDAFGVPSDPEVRAAVMEATCAQAAFFDEIGDVSGATAGSGGSLGPLTLPNRAATAGGSVTRAQTSQEAADILRSAGLLSAVAGGGAGAYTDKTPTVAPPVPLPAALVAHIADETPHPAYDDGPSPSILFENGLD